MGNAHDIGKLHAAIDVMVARIVEAHGDRLRCAPGCCDCCVDGLTVFEVEAQHILDHHAEALSDPHPPGRCALLDRAGRCRVYPHRPYVCRTQGLPLRWIDETGDVVERRDICPLNEPGPAIEELPPELCWTIGVVEGRLASMQAALDGGALRRVALRDLFVPRIRARRGSRPRARRSRG
jgi:hypothetical protein